MNKGVLMSPGCVTYTLHNNHSIQIADYPVHPLIIKLDRLEIHIVVLKLNNFDDRILTLLNMALKEMQCASS